MHDMYTKRQVRAIKRVRDLLLLLLHTQLVSTQFDIMQCLVSFPDRHGCVGVISHLFRAGMLGSQPYVVHEPCITCTSNLAELTIGLASEVCKANDKMQPDLQRNPTQGNDASCQMSRQRHTANTQAEAKPSRSTILEVPQVLLFCSQAVLLLILCTLNLHYIKGASTHTMHSYS